MSVNMNPLSHKISSLQTYHFAKPEAKEKETALKDDAVQISREAAEHAAGIREMDIPADPIGQKLSSMTKEEFADMLRTWQDENQVPLEVNQRASVDPDGTIWAKAYFDAYVQQAVAEKNAVQSYYAGALQEAQRPTLPESLNFITSKYQCSWSENFAKDMTDGERQWAYKQLRTMLMGGSPALNDPYALASMGGVKTVEDHTRAAKEAANKALDELVRQAELIEE